MSNGLIYVYIVGIHVKELSHHASREICHNQSEFSNYYLVYNMPIICRKYILPIIPKLCYITGWLSTSIRTIKVQKI